MKKIHIILVFLLLAGVRLDVAQATDMKEQKMIQSAGSRTMQIRDETKGITFPMWLLYPSPDAAREIKMGPYSVNASPDGIWADGKFPLVVISHGGGGSHLLYRITAEHLARNGFIVAMPEHHGNNRNDNSLEDKNENLTVRTRHVQLVIDRVLSDPQLSSHIDAKRIVMIGHSMGGATALAVSGAVPWSKRAEKIVTTHDERVKALVLLAPATAWYQHPASFEKVNIPMRVYSAEHDTLTPKWQADLIKSRVKKPEFVNLKVVANAGHLSFLAPFPTAMSGSNFLPSQDPEGFDRAAFHQTLKAEILAYFCDVLSYRR